MARSVIVDFPTMDFKNGGGISDGTDVQFEPRDWLGPETGEAQLFPPGGNPVEIELIVRSKLPRGSIDAKLHPE